MRLWNRPGYQDHLRDFYLAVSNVSDRSRWPSRCREPDPEACAALEDSEDMVVRRVEGRFDRRVQARSPPPLCCSLPAAMQVAARHNPPTTPAQPGLWRTPLC